jgi:hypothetical protein
MTPAEQADALCVVDAARRLRIRCEQEGMGGVLFAGLFEALDAFDKAHAPTDPACRNEDCHHAAASSTAPPPGTPTCEPCNLLMVRKDDGYRCLNCGAASPAPRPAYLTKGTSWDGSPALETTTCPAGDDE